MKTTTSNSGLKVKTSIKSGGIMSNHNETLVQPPSKNLKVKTNVRAGGMAINHNQTLVRG